MRAEYKKRKTETKATGVVNSHIGEHQQKRKRKLKSLKQQIFCHNIKKLQIIISWKNLLVKSTCFKILRWLSQG